MEISLPERIDIAAMAEKFHHAYEREYTYRLDAPIEFVGLHVVASAQVGKLQLEPLPVTGRSIEQTRKGERNVDYLLEGIHRADIYDGDVFEPGMQFAGPAIVEQESTTIVVGPRQTAHVDDYGNLHIMLKELQS